MFETTAREVAVDYAARQIGMDPVEFRRKNLLAFDDLPFTAPSGNVFQEISPLETLDQALEILDYDAFRREQIEAREEGRYLGLGIAVYVEPTSMNVPSLQSEAATVRVETSGQVMAFLGTTSHGQSIETTMAQVVAEHLGVDYDDVTVVQADTQSTPYGGGTGGSRTAVIAGGAARSATLAVRDKVLAIAAHTMEASPDDLEIENGRVAVRGTPSRAMTHERGRDRRVPEPRHAAARADGGLEATMRFRRRPVPDVVERVRTRASSRSTGGRGSRASSATS